MSARTLATSSRVASSWLRVPDSIATSAVLILLLAAVTLVTTTALPDDAGVVVTEMLIRTVIVVGLYVFVGNSGTISFGHIGFACVGAYAAAWGAMDPTVKAIMLPGLPDWIASRQYGFLASTAGAVMVTALVALPLGACLSRLSGIAASIATFAFLAIVNSAYSNWDSVTGGTSSLINIPQWVGPWTACGSACVAIAVAGAFQHSRVGMMLRASRESAVAARACAIPVEAVRVAAFVLSGALVGLGGALYAQFLGVLSVDQFYLGLSFITLAMLVAGGIESLCGAVSGVLLVTTLIQLLRMAESGFQVGAWHIALPAGSQEVGLGVFLAIVLIARPEGVVGPHEWFARRTQPPAGR